MRSVLLIVACIALMILAIKIYNVAQENKTKHEQPVSSRFEIIKNHFFLPDEIRMVGLP